MDTRTGDIYPDLQAALDAGVPREHLAEVEPIIVRVTSGPFKGRVYKRTPTGGLKRIDSGLKLSWED